MGNLVFNAALGGSTTISGPNTASTNTITIPNTSGALVVSATTLDVSKAVATDSSGVLVSVTNTGTGNNVLATSPTLVTPNLGTPSTLVGTNITGIPNAGLLNSTISGISLGSNLANLIAGTNITFSTGSTYNGSTAITINAAGGGGGSGTVTSVNLTASTGISVSGGPITTSGSITVTNTAPMTYPGAGIGNSTGSAWGTSYTTSGTGTVLALATAATMTGVKETQIAIAASNIDLSLGNYFTKTISTTTTFTVSNTASSGTVNSLIFDLTNGGSSAVTWWSGVKWASGTAPTLTASGRDVLGFFTEDGGTTWNGFVLGKAMA